MDLKLRIYPDSVLRERAKEIDTFDPELRELGEAMVDTMYRERGIGLAAPQVGIGRRIIVALQMRDIDDGDAPPLVLVNPRVVDISDDLVPFEEGCLSIPGVNASVKRPTWVRVEYQDLDGNPHVVENDDMFARILQHEIDHLDGRLFIDYLSTAQKSLIKSRLRELAGEDA